MTFEARYAQLSEIGEDREGEKVIHYDVINQPCRDTGQLITIAINTVTYYL